MKFFYYWIPFLSFAALIFAFSSFPGDQIAPWFPILDYPFPIWFTASFDKIIHGMVYGILGWLSLRAVAMGSLLTFPLAAILAFLICSLYGATDEWHQSFAPGRSANFFDWLADSTGSLMMIILLYHFYAHETRFH